MASDEKVNSESKASDPIQSIALQRALDLVKQGLTTSAIARDIGVHPATVRRWLRSNGVAPFTHPNLFQKGKQGASEPVLEKDALQQEIDSTLESVTVSAISDARLAASLEEDKVLAEIADAQSSPADKYQHYVAAAAIKLLRDGIRGLKPPKTVRELSELDQLIRRNLGLNAKTGGGSSKLSIDISILNNGAADKGNGTVKSMKNQIIDVEEENDFES